MFCGCRVNGEQNGSKLKDTIPVLQCRNSIFSKNLLSVCAQETFSLIDHRLFQLLWKWAKRRHPEKGRKWVKDRYWHSKGTRHWVFSSENSELIALSYIPIIRYTKV